MLRLLLLLACLPSLGHSRILFADDFQSYSSGNLLTQTPRPNYTTYVATTADVSAPGWGGLAGRISNGAWQTALQQSVTFSNMVLTGRASYTDRMNFEYGDAIGTINVNNGYVIVLQPAAADDLIVYEFTAGTPVSIATATTAPTHSSSDFNFKFVRLMNGEISLYINGVLGITVSDSSITTGKFGFSTFGGANFFDDLLATDGKSGNNPAQTFDKTFSLWDLFMPKLHAAVPGDADFGQTVFRIKDQNAVTGNRIDRRIPVTPTRTPTVNARLTPTVTPALTPGR